MTQTIEQSIKQIQPRRNITYNICLQCGNEFPKNLNINGIRFKLSRRKHCLSCSPHEGVNKLYCNIEILPSKNEIRSNIEIQDILVKRQAEIEEKRFINNNKCHYCGIEIQYWSKKNTKIPRNCSKCKEKLKSLRIKYFSIQYLGGKCVQCGKVSNLRNDMSCFDFHHRSSSEKSFEISKAQRGKGWIILKKELDKCDLLCAPCHRMIHYNDISENMYSEIINYQYPLK